MTPNTAAPKIDGRSRAARAMRAQATSIDPDDDVTAAAAPARQSARQSTREPAREPARSSSRAAVVTGRNGEVLSRKRTLTSDIFHIPDNLIPKGWSYQWCAVSVVGNTEILMDQNLMMAENGWRPVPASRYPGRFMPEGHKGNIIRGGQMLMERPEALSIEARAEDVRLARQLISDRNESLKLAGVKAQMPDGFNMSGKYRGTGGDIRISVDHGADVPAPSHQLAEPGE